jgi:hypothetical protein
MNSDPDESEDKPIKEKPPRRINWPWWVWLVIILFPIPIGVGPWWAAAIFMALFAVLILALAQHYKE